MRVRNICNKKKLVVRSGNNVILEKKRPHMIPSEMETLKIDKEKLSLIKEDICVCVGRFNYEKRSNLYSMP